MIIDYWFLLSCAAAFQGPCYKLANRSKFCTVIWVVSELKYLFTSIVTEKISGSLNKTVGQEFQVAIKISTT